MMKTRIDSSLGCGNYSRVETIHRKKLFAEIYINFCYTESAKSCVTVFQSNWIYEVTSAQMCLHMLQKELFSKYI